MVRMQELTSYMRGIPEQSHPTQSTKVTRVGIEGNPPCAKYAKDMVPLSPTDSSALNFQGSLHVVNLHLEKYLGADLYMSKTNARKYQAGHGATVDQVTA